MTVAEAARRAGVSRQALDAAIDRGKLRARASGRTRLIRQADLAEWIATRRPRPAPSLAAGLSFRQVETLLALAAGRDLENYSWFLATNKALRRRGLIESPRYGRHRLTPAGQAVVNELAARGELAASANVIAFPPDRRGCEPGQCEGHVLAGAGFGGQDMTVYCEPQEGAGGGG